MGVPFLQLQYKIFPGKFLQTSIQIFNETSMSKELIIGIIALIIFLIIKRPRIGKDEPPLVPYKIPIIGHTIVYLLDTRKFIRECFDKYGDSFSIYVFGKVMTILARDPMNEMFSNHENFDMPTAANEFLPQYEVFIYTGGITTENIRFQSETTREQVIANLDYNISISQKYVVKAIDKWIGDCNDPKPFHDAWRVINSIMALPIANVFAGEEAAVHEDLVKSFGDMPFDLNNLMAIPPILTFIHKRLHDFALFLPLKYGWNPMSHHRKVVGDRLRPVIEKRLKERKWLGDNYKPYKDVLEYYMNQPNFDYTKPDCLFYFVEHMLGLVFAVSSVSKGAANAIYDLAGRPEYMDELYEEALAISRECNGSFTSADLKKMKKLDSFIKESFRHTEETLNVPHYVTSEKFTFSNGFSIPKGRLVIAYSEDSLKLKKVYGDDADEFVPFRFVDKNSPATKVDRSFMFFGGGKHACPGRFFAVGLIKLLMHYLILNYTMSTKSEKVESKIHIGPMSIPPRSDIIFENRRLPMPY